MIASPETVPADPVAVDRPLSLGEILDRAVTLAVRRFGSFAAIFALVLIPLACVEPFTANNGTALVDALTHANGNSQAILRAVGGIKANAADYLQYAILLIGLPIAAGAAVVAASRAYDGQTTDIRAALAHSVRRYPSFLGLVVVWIVGFAMAFGAVLFVVLFITFGIVAAVRGTGALQQAAVPIVIAIMSIVAVLAALLYAVGAVAWCTLVVETTNPFAATGRAFSRVFRGREIWRAAVVGIVLIAVSLAVSFVALGIGGFLYAVTHVKLLLVAISTLASFVSYIAQYVFTTVYYRDVRLRREGGDLLAPLAPLGAAS